MFDFLLFLYFFTLHADQLNLSLGGFSIRLNNVIALGLCALFIIKFKHKLICIDRTLFLSLLLLTLSILISFFLTPYKRRCVFFLGWYGFTVLMYFLIPYLLICYSDARRLFSLYLLSFLLVGVYAFLQLVLSLFGFNDPFASQRIIKTIVRPNAFAYEPSFYALYMTPFMVLVNYHFLAEREQPFFWMNRLTYPKVLGINFLYFASTSTSTFFAFIIFFFCLLFSSQVRRNLWKYGIVFTLLFFALGLVSPLLIQKFFLKFFYSDFQSHASFYERWNGIENAWNIFQLHPFFGIGLGGYPEYLYDAFLSGDQRFSILYSDLTVINAPNPLKLMEPMNVFTEILASLGVFGAVCFALFLVQIAFHLKRARQYDFTLAQGLFLSVLVMVIVLQFNQGIFRTYVWVHFAIALSILEKIARETTPLSLQSPSQLYGSRAEEELA